MNVIRRALTGNEPVNGSESDLANLYRDDDLIDILDTTQTRLSLVDELETTVSIDQSPLNHGSIRGGSTVGDGSHPLFLVPSDSSTVRAGGTSAVKGHQSHVTHCCPEDQLIGDVASSESTSLLEDSSEESGADGSNPVLHCHQSVAGTTSNEEAGRGATWKLCCAFVLCLCFMAAEMVGAYVSNR